MNKPHVTPGHASVDPARLECRQRRAGCNQDNEPADWVRPCCDICKCLELERLGAMIAAIKAWAVGMDQWAKLQIPTEHGPVYVTISREAQFPHEFDYIEVDGLPT